jgi:hypothetical protein
MIPVKEAIEMIIENSNFFEIEKVNFMGIQTTILFIPRYILFVISLRFFKPYLC